MYVMAGRISDNKIFLVDYQTAYDGTRSTVTHVAAVSADGKVHREWDDLDAALHGISELGAVVAYVWDMSTWGCFLDYYALSRGMKHADEAERANAYGRVNEECWNALYAAGRGVMNFKLTLRRTRKTHNFGGGRIGALHTVEYRGLSAFFGGMRIDEAAAACKTDGDGVDALRGIYAEYIRVYSRLSGEDVQTRSYMSRVYTIGGAARRKYLRTRYGVDSLARYQKEHPATEAMEDYLRERRLLLSGMCFFSDTSVRKLHTATLYKKYDVNSLYTSIADTAGELASPEKTDFNAFCRERSGEYAYIIIVKDFRAWLKKGAAPVFESPFPAVGGTGNNINIDHQFAMFRELWDALHKYYLFEDFEIVTVLRCKKLNDTAIVQYNRYFEGEKMKADAEGDKMLRRVCKLYMNNIIGKMSQKTKYIPIIPRYNAANDMVVFARGELVDNWEKGHFDFVRGAYIYTLARVRVMEDIYRIMGAKSGTHHYYTDTDSIVTDLQMGAADIDPRKIGAYKVERTYDAFGVIGKKVYYGHSAEVGNELICAGIPRGLVLSQIAEAYGDLPPDGVFDVLKMDIKYHVPRHIRVSGGAACVDIEVKISEVKDGIYDSLFTVG